MGSEEFRKSLKVLSETAARAEKSVWWNSTGPDPDFEDMNEGRPSVALVVGPADPLFLMTEYSKGKGFSAWLSDKIDGGPIDGRKEFGKTVKEAFGKLMEHFSATPGLKPSICDDVFRRGSRSDGFRWLLEHGFVPASWTENSVLRDNAFVHNVNEEDGTRVYVYVALYGDEWLAWCRRCKKNGWPYEGDSDDYSGDIPEQALDKMIEGVGLKLGKE